MRVAKCNLGKALPTLLRDEAGEEEAIHDVDDAVGCQQVRLPNKVRLPKRKVRRADRVSLDQSIIDSEEGFGSRDAADEELRPR